jgi:DNA-binding transcriptional LysR family regulator
VSSGLPNERSRQIALRQRSPEALFFAKGDAKKASPIREGEMHAAVLRYVDQVARMGSIRRAAEALHVASSAVNRQILKLEEELGTVLFERRRNGVVPTAAGEILLRHIRETMSDFQTVKAEMAGMAGVVTGHVRIICLESVALRFMPRVVEELARAHPQVSFTVLAVNPSHIGEEMRSGQTDFGVLFTDRRFEGVEVVATFRTAVGAVMRPDHPLARRRSVTLTECAQHPVVMLHDRWLLDAIMTTEFAQSGARLAPRVVSNSIEFMRQVILHDLGIGFFSPIGFIDDIKRGELVHVPLAEPQLAGSGLGVLVPQHKRITPAARVAMDHVRASLGSFLETLS